MDGSTSSEAPSKPNEASPQTDNNSVAASKEGSQRDSIEILRSEFASKLAETAAAYDARIVELQTELSSEREARQRLENYLASMSRGESVAPYDPAGPAVGVAVSEAHTRERSSSQSSGSSRSPRVSITLTSPAGSDQPPVSPRGRSKSVTLSSTEVSSVLKPDPVARVGGDETTLPAVATATTEPASPVDVNEPRKERTKKRSLSFSLNPLKAIKSKSEKTLPKIKASGDNNMEKDKSSKSKDEKKKKTGEKDRHEKKQNATVIPPGHSASASASPANGHASNGSSSSHSRESSSSSTSENPRGMYKMWRAFRNSFVNKKTMGPNKKASGNDLDKLVVAVNASPSSATASTTATGNKEAEKATAKRTEPEVVVDDPLLDIGPEVDFTSCELSTVPQIVMQKLQHISALRLGNNSLLTFPNLTSYTLQEIDLSLNKIPSIPITITQIPYLRCLFLYGNKLSRLPEEIGQLTRLEFVDISKNNLLDLPGSIGNLTCLRELLVFGNKMTYLPRDIGKLVNLEVLDVSENALRSVPSDICKLSKLQELNLYLNKLAELPEDIGNLGNLRELNVAENFLTDLPMSCGKLKFLRNGFHVTMNCFSNSQLKQAVAKGSVSVYNFVRQRLSQYSPGSVPDEENPPPRGATHGIDSEAENMLKMMMSLGDSQAASSSSSASLNPDDGPVRASVMLRELEGEDWLLRHKRMSMRLSVAVPHDSPLPSRQVSMLKLLAELEDEDSSSSRDADNSPKSSPMEESILHSPSLLPSPSSPTLRRSESSSPRSQSHNVRPSSPPNQGILSTSSDVSPPSTPKPETPAVKLIESSPPAAAAASVVSNTSPPEKDSSVVPAETVKSPAEEDEKPVVSPVPTTADPAASPSRPAPQRQPSPNRPVLNRSLSMSASQKLSSSVRAKGRPPPSPPKTSGQKPLIRPPTLNNKNGSSNENKLDQKILVLASWARNVINSEFKPRLQQIALTVGQSPSLENVEAAAAVVEPMERTLKKVDPYLPPEFHDNAMDRLMSKLASNLEAKRASSEFSGVESEQTKQEFKIRALELQGKLAAVVTLLETNPQNHVVIDLVHCVKDIKQAID